MNVAINNKALHIGVSFLSFGKNVFGGMEKGWYNLCQGFLENNHGVSVFTGCMTGVSSEIDGIKIYRSSCLPKKVGGNTADLATKLVVERENIKKDFDDYQKTYKPDHLILVDPLWGILQVSEAWKISNAPISISYHIANRSGVRREIMATSFQIPYRRRFAVSKFLIEEINREFLESESKEIIVKPTPTYIGDYIKEYPTENYIFCNSRIDPIKRIDTLVYAFSKIHKKYQIKLKLCGGGSPFMDLNSELEKIKKIVKDLKLEKEVEFLPRLEWEEIPELVLKSKLIVLPSSRETFGGAALEALVAGRPLVTTTGGNLPVLAGRSGVIVEPGNIESLAGAMDEVLGNYAKYEHKALNGRELFNKFDRKVVAGEMLDHLLRKG